jgi:hypothetical protein
MPVDWVCGQPAHVAALRLKRSGLRRGCFDGSPVAPPLLSGRCLRAIARGALAGIVALDGGALAYAKGCASTDERY